MIPSPPHILKRRLWFAALFCIAVLFLGYHFWPTATVTQPDNTQELQQRVQSAIRKASPAVVCIDGAATGTIISPDGLILSQAHVTHDQRQDGDRVKITLADGRELMAKLIAQDRGVDVSLARLESGGPFPYLTLDESRPLLGDYVIKLGHPGRLHPQRGQVARLGRVVSTLPGQEATDCLIYGGDSGGPFIDLDGGLTGMVGGSVGRLPGSNVPHELDDAVSQSRLSKLIASKQDPSKKSTAGPHAWKFTPAVDLAHTVESLLKRGSQASPVPPALPPQKLVPSGKWPAPETAARVLPHCDWMNGTRHAHRFAGPGKVSALRERLVMLVTEKGQFGSGIFIDAQHALARASTLPERFQGAVFGRESPVSFTVVARDAKNDLALLKTQPLEFANSFTWQDAAPDVGTVLITPLPESAQSIIGIVSVGLRHTETPRLGPSSAHLFYDTDVSPDAEFAASFDTDLHLHLIETGLPVLDSEARCVGIAIRSSFIGTRVIPAKSIREWLAALLPKS